MNSNSKMDTHLTDVGQLARHNISTGQLAGSENVTAVQCDSDILSVPSIKHVVTDEGLLARHGVLGDIGHLACQNIKSYGKGNSNRNIGPHQGGGGNKNRANREQARGNNSTTSNIVKGVGLLSVNGRHKVGCKKVKRTGDRLSYPTGGVGSNHISTKRVDSTYGVRERVFESEHGKVQKVVKSTGCKSPYYVTLEKSLKQIGVLFERSTLCPLSKPEAWLAKDCSKEEYFQAVTKICQTNLPNYKGAKIQVGSTLNLIEWHKYIDHFKDKHLLNLLTFGFPLGILKRENLNRKNITNHSSARMYPRAVAKYIEKETKEGVLLGPFTEVPHDELHVSPLMSRPKDISDRRIIVDLSFGDSEAVNTHTERGSYEGIECRLQLPTIDHILNQIINTQNPRLIKVDISRAFKNIPIDPRDAVKCGIQVGGSYYVDKSLVFGAVNGTLIIQRVSGAIVEIMKGTHKVDLWNYIDDVFSAIEASKANRVFEDLCSLIQQLGLPLNDKKLQGPCRRMEVMGIVVDLDSETLEISKSKMVEIRTL